MVYLPLGIVDVNPITKIRTIGPNQPILKVEKTWQETLEYIKMLNSKQFILSHIEEPDGITYEVGVNLGEYCSSITGKDIRLAFDMMECEI